MAEIRLTIQIVNGDKILAERDGAIPFEMDYDLPKGLTPEQIFNESDLDMLTRMTNPMTEKLRTLVGPTLVSMLQELQDKAKRSIQYEE